MMPAAPGRLPPLRRAMSGGGAADSRPGSSPTADPADAAAAHPHQPAPAPAPAGVPDLGKGSVRELPLSAQTSSLQVQVQASTMSAKAPPAISSRGSFSDVRADGQKTQSPRYLQKELQKRTEDLHNLKIDTMYKMVDTLLLNSGVEKKVLYLKNRDAEKITEKHVPNLLKAMGIITPESSPKLAITVMTSYGQSRHWVRSQREDKAKLGTVPGPYEWVSPHSPQKLEEMELNFVRFAKEVLLPVVRRGGPRSTLLIVDAQQGACSVASGIQAAFEDVARQTGEDCPFVVVGHSRHLWMHNATRIEGKNAHRLMHHKDCTTWRERCQAPDGYVHSQLVANAQAHRPESPETSWLMTECVNDVSLFPSHYLITEDIDEHASKQGRVGDGYQINPSMMDFCLGNITSYLATMIPTLTIQSMNAANGIGDLAFLASRNTPLLLLDPYERALYKRHEKHMPLNAEVDADGVIEVEKVKEEILADARREAGPSSDEGIRKITGTYKYCFTKQYYTQHQDTTVIAALRSLLYEISGRNRQMKMPGLLYHVIEHMESRSNTWEAGSHDDKQTKLVRRTAVIDAVQCLVALLKEQAQMRSATVDKLAGQKEGEALSDFWAQGAADDDLQSVIQKLGRQVGCGNIDFPQYQQHAHELLSRDNVRGYHLGDFEAIAEFIDTVSNTERLAPRNTLQGMKLLRQGWDQVDACRKGADWYKTVTNLSYALLLCIGLALIILSVVTYSGRDGSIGMDEKDITTQENVILALSVLGATATGYINFVNPAQKWIQLRGAQLSLKSELFRFRTRTGVYHENHIAFGRTSEACEKHLQKTLLDFSDQVLKGADVRSTSFWAYDPEQIGTHGQYRSSPNSKVFFMKWLQSLLENAGIVVGSGRRQWFKDRRWQDLHRSNYAEVIRVLPASWDPQAPAQEGKGGFTEQKDDDADVRRELVPVVDDFQSPLTPQMYIESRIRSEIRFYRARLPRYSRMRLLLQGLLLIGSGTSVVFASVDFGRWIAIVSGVMGAVTAWQEFSGVSKKLERASGTMQRLQALLTWWDSSTKLDMASQANIERLVNSAEDALCRELEAWMGTNQAAQALQQQQQPGPGAGGGSAGAAEKQKPGRTKGTGKPEEAWP